MNSQAPLEVARPLLICFSHLRWNFVFQRPQHLMTRAAREFRVVFFEEPLFEHAARPHLRVLADPSGVLVATPIIPLGVDAEPRLIRALLDDWLTHSPHPMLVTWYYTPMALQFSGHLAPEVCVYDCMDELSGFLNPPPELQGLENDLFERADVVFTGGHSLYDAKKNRHSNIHAFPSSVDVRHFGRARVKQADPADQSHIPHPRIGFFGVVDERMDIGLVGAMAEALPEVQFVMVGPVVKIDEAHLPKRDNLHWLGGRSYDELPQYLGNWDAGWMPFALNEATRFISPTKTPEFLAAGLPLTSTAVPDVVSGYGNSGVVTIADRDAMAGALRQSLVATGPERLAKADKLLATMSWDKTWKTMSSLVNRSAAARTLYAAQ